MSSRKQFFTNPLARPIPLEAPLKTSRLGDEEDQLRTGAAVATETTQATMQERGFRRREAARLQLAWKRFSVFWRSSHFAKFAIVFLLGMLALSFSMIVYSSVYYASYEVFNKLSTLAITFFLLFGTAQVIVVLLAARSLTTWVYPLGQLYWLVIFLCSLIIAGGWGATGQNLNLMIGVFAGLQALLGGWVQTARDQFDSHGLDRPPARQCCNVRCTFTSLNRVLKVLHFIYAILLANGAIVISKATHAGPNVGTVLPVTFPSGHVHNINTYCTTPTLPSPEAPPTIHLLSSIAHGTTDFLGLQHYLAAAPYYLATCSHDPPSFGWSDPLNAADSPNLGAARDYYPAVLRALTANEAEKPIVLLGWGGGAEDAVHIAQLPYPLPGNYTLSGLVLLDATPDGLEWAQRAAFTNTTSDAASLRSSDLSSRIGLVRLILGLIIPFGLQGQISPNNSTGYYPPKSFNVHRAQGMKEDFWAAQRAVLEEMRARNGSEWQYERSYLNVQEEVELPAGVELLHVLTNKTGKAEETAEERFNRKMQLSESVALTRRLLGGAAVNESEVEKRVVQCGEEETACDKVDPVLGAAWLAARVGDWMVGKFRS